MLEPIVRAICALIVICGLLLWLAQSAAKGGRVSRFLARFDSSLPAQKAPKNRTAKPTRMGLAGFTAASLTALRPGSSKIKSPKAGKGKQRPAPVVSVVARQPLMGRTSLSVVDLDGKRLVLGVSDSGVSLLTSYDSPAQDFDQIIANLTAQADEHENETVTHTD